MKPREKMSQDSIKKSGYLEKLPVKGLMKVGSVVTPLTPSPISLAHRNGTDDGLSCTQQATRAWSG